MPELQRGVGGLNSASVNVHYTDLRYNFNYRFTDVIASGLDNCADAVKRKPVKIDIDFL